jgi:chemotaxis protein CheX
VNVKYINPFIDATLNVFETFLQTPAKTGKPYLFDHAAEQSGWDISGIIGLAGEILGVVVISFPTTLALKLVSFLEKRETKIIDESVVDLVGEIINIIAGNAKKDLEEHKIAISLPTVVRGARHRFPGPSVTPMVAIPFTCEKGEFSLQVSMKNLL